MMGDSHDDDLEKLFADLRAADQRDAPPFGSIYVAALANAHKRAATVAWRRTATVAAAAVILLAAGSEWLVLRSRDSRSPSRLSSPASATVSLSEWRSPTAFLLNGPGDLLLKTVPIISASSAELNALGVRAAPRRHS